MVAIMGNMEDKQELDPMMYDVDRDTLDKASNAVKEMLNTGNHDLMIQSVAFILKMNEQNQRRDDALDKRKRLDENRPTEISYSAHELTLEIEALQSQYKAVKSVSELKPLEIEVAKEKEQADEDGK